MKYNRKFIYSKRPSVNDYGGFTESRYYCTLTCPLRLKKLKKSYWQKSFLDVKNRVKNILVENSVNKDSC